MVPLAEVPYEPQVTLRTRRGQKVYEYMLSEPVEVVLETPGGPVRITLDTQGRVAIRGDWNLIIRPEAGNALTLELEGP